LASRLRPCPCLEASLLELRQKSHVRMFGDVALANGRMAVQRLYLPR
jgi:hypothetical protein